MGKAERKTGGAFEGANYWEFEPDRPRPTQPIVVRLWPSSWNPNKWIVEMYAEQKCNVELAVLPVSSPCGSEEADELTKLLLSESGARLFSQGHRIYNGAIAAQTLREALYHEQQLVAVKELTRLERSLRTEQEQRTKEQIAAWRKRLEELKS